MAKAWSCACSTAPACASAWTTWVSSPTPWRASSTLARPHGILLVTGPTGSGKTTTLYAALAKLDAQATQKIITVEDPVEYQLEGINQIQVHPRST
jgi:general secretion pathway protein E